MYWHIAAFHERGVIGLYLPTLLLACAYFYVCRKPWYPLRDILAAGLALLVMGCINLVADFYQESEPLWRRYLLWFLVCTPFLIITTRSRIMAAAWAIAAILAYALTADIYDPLRPEYIAKYLEIADPYWPPALALALAATGLSRLGPERQAQANGIWAALIAHLMLISTAPLLDIFMGTIPSMEIKNLSVGATLALIIISLIAALRRIAGGQMIDTISVLAFCALGVWILCWVLAAITGGNHLVGAPVIAFWIIATALTYLSGNKTVFALSCLATGAIASTVFLFPHAWEYGTQQAMALASLIAFSALVWRLTKRVAAKRPPR